MEDNEYDEFGNYIGGKDRSESESRGEEDESDIDTMSFPTSSSSSSSFDESSEEEQEKAKPKAGINKTGDLVLKEESKDQVIAADASFYGEGVEMIVADEDAQEITKPIMFDTSSTVTRYFSPDNPAVKVLRQEGYCEKSRTGPFMQQIVQEFPHRIRTVAVLGHLHHGKTSLSSCLIMDGEQSQKYPKNLLDTRRLEYDKKISMAMHPFSTIVRCSSLNNEESQKKSNFSFLLNGIDCPGHTNFEDEALAGAAIADGAIIVVDVAEGVREGTRRALDQVVRRNMSFIVLLNKIDRLVLELHLPPLDAYLKLYQIVQEINKYVAGHGVERPPVTPANGSVIFGSTTENWFFSLADFASLYESHANIIQTNTESLAHQFWGTWRYDRARGVVTTEKVDTEEDRDPFTFVKFVLEPIYKIYSAVLAKEPEMITDALGIQPPLTAKEQSLRMKDLFPLCIHRFLHPSRKMGEGHCSSVGTAVMRHIDDAKTYAEREIFRSLPAPQGIAFAKIIKFVQFPIQKQVQRGSMSRSSTFEADLFYPVVRVTHGQLAVGMTCQLMEMDIAPNFCQEEKQKKSFTIDSMYLIDPIHGLQYTSRVTDGAMVCLRGFTLTELQTGFPFKEGLLYATTESQQSLVEVAPSIVQNLMLPALPLQRLRRNQCVVKVGIEAVNSTVDFGNLLYAIRCIEYMHPGCKSVREETGERVLLSLGEFSMDTVLFEIREVFGRSARENLHGAPLNESNTEAQPEIGVLKIRVSDPFVCFAESVTEESQHPVDRELTLYGADPSTRKSQVSFVADPLSKKMQSDFLGGVFQDAKLQNGESGVRHTLRERHGWDAFDLKNLWCFGPHPSYGPNMLVNEASFGDDDTSSSETDSSDSESDSDESTHQAIPQSRQVELLRDNFIEGFRWAMVDGPLCGEPVQGVAVRLIDTKINNVNFSDSLELARLQRAVVSGTRQGVASCLLASQPCLLEPLYTLNIESTHAARGVVYALVSKRRGKVMQEERRPGSVLYDLTAEVPVLDSFGLETEIRIESAGEAFAESRFSGWDTVPGGPAGEILAEIERHQSYAIASADVDTDPVPPRKLTEDIILKIRRRKGMFNV